MEVDLFSFSPYNTDVIYNDVISADGSWGACSLRGARGRGVRAGVGVEWGGGGVTAYIWKRTFLKADDICSSDVLNNDVILFDGR